MSHKHLPTALEKEFELERVILFSDAVFAIAITLLIIDIKWPEGERLAGESMWKHLQPTILSFAAFIISFFFIGRFWALHLEIFRLLRRYNQGLIKRNLLFLFFIVTFPFTASGLAGHVRPGFLLPLYLYFINVICVSGAHLLLCQYIRKQPLLAAEGFAAEKKYFYIRSLYTTLVLVVMLGMLITTNIVFSGKLEYVTASPALLGVMMPFVRRKIKKYKPAGMEEY